MLVDPKTKQLHHIFDLIVIDSMNTVIPGSIVDTYLEKGVEGTPQIASKSMLQTKFADRLMSAQLLRDGCHLLILAQARANMSGMPGMGSSLKMSMGEALKHAAKLIVQLSPVPMYKNLTVDGKTKRVKIGHTINVNVEKQGVKGEIKKGEYSVMYGEGVDDSQAVSEKLEMLGYCLKNADWGRNVVKIPLRNGDWTFKKKTDVIERIKLDPEFKDMVKEVIRNHDPKIKDFVAQLKGFDAEQPSLDVKEESEPVD